MSDICRLKKLMERAENGETLTIGFIGGSITQGSLASCMEKTYAYRVFEWWKNQFPRAEFRYVNAGIGGTSSHFGVARVQQDLLIYRPDFVVIDFSVNDDFKQPAFYKETFEGLLRKVYYSETNPAIVVLNNVYYDTGINMQKIHNEVADYYGILHVSIKDNLLPRVFAGEYNIEDLTSDNLHPNDKGHELVAREICNLLQDIKNKDAIPCNAMQNPAIEKDLVQEKDAITMNVYEKSSILTIANVSPKLEGFLVDAEEKKGHLDFFKNGWIGRKVGDAIHFTLEASCIAVQYRKTIHRPAPIAQLILDGDRSHPMILDGNFDEDWGDCLFLQTVLHHGKREKHQIDIEIIEDNTSNTDASKTEFYLMSLIYS